MIDDEGAAPVRAELDALAAAAPPVGFTAGDVLDRGRRTRRLRRGAAVGGTAAALALVVAVPAVAFRGPDTVGGVAGSSRTATPVVPSPTAAPGPPVPGLSPAAADRAARACALAYGGPDGRSGDPSRNPPVSPGAGSPTPTGPGSPVPTSPEPPYPTGTAAPTPGAPYPTDTAAPTSPGTPYPTGTAAPTSPGDLLGTPGPTAAGYTPSASPQGWDGGATAPRLQDVVHVHNRVVDAAGEHLLVYGPWDYLSCDRADGRTYDAGGASGLSTGWLPGPVAVDALTAAPGRRHAGADAPAGPGYVLMEGRVSRQVARLAVTVGPDTAAVRPVNGTFLVRFVKSATWPATGVGRFSVTPYDRSGQVLPGTSTNSKRGCWVDPAGRVVVGNRENTAAPCTPATPWR